MFRSAFVLLICALPVVAASHPGGLDANGGHHNRKTGEYHVHRSSYTPSPSPPKVASIPQSVLDFAGGKRTIGFRTSTRTTPRTRPAHSRTSDIDSDSAELVESVKRVKKLLEGNETAQERSGAVEELELLTKDYAGTPEAGEALALLREIRTEEREERRKEKEDFDQAAAAEREATASGKLKLARTFLVSRRYTGARRWFSAIVDAYPETKAAAEARTEIDKIDALIAATGGR